MREGFGSAARVGFLGFEGDERETEREREGRVEVGEGRVFKWAGSYPKSPFIVGSDYNLRTKVGKKCTEQPLSI